MTEVEKLRRDLDEMRTKLGNLRGAIDAQIKAIQAIADKVAAQGGMINTLAGRMMR